MLTIENDLTKFFSFIGNEGKQKRFYSLIKEKNLTLDDLDLIFQTVRLKHSGINSDIRRVCSVTVQEVLVSTINKGKGTEDSPVLQTNLWWTKDGNFIGETTNLGYELR